MRNIIIILLLLLNVDYSVGQVKQTTPKNFSFYSAFDANLRRYFMEKWNTNIPKYLPCSAYNNASALNEKDPYFQLINVDEDTRVFCAWKNEENKPVKAYYWTEPIYKSNNAKKIIDSLYMSVIIQETDSFVKKSNFTIPIRKVLIRFTRNQPLVSSSPRQYQTLPKSVADELRKMPNYYRLLTGDLFYKEIVSLKDVISIYRIKEARSENTLSYYTDEEKKQFLDTIKYTKSIKEHIVNKYQLSEFPKLIKEGEYGFDHFQIYATDVKLEDNSDGLLFVGLRCITPLLAQDEEGCEYLVAEVVVPKSILSEEIYVQLLDFLSKLNAYNRFINFGTQWDYLF